MPNNKKVLVTGANGYIGRHVVKELLRRGLPVFAVDTKAAQTEIGAKVLYHDIFSGESNLFHEFGSPDVCIHLAWKDGFSHNSDSHIKLLSDHYKFLSNLLDAGLRQLVVMGSMHEIGYYEGMIDEYTPCNPISLYGIAKDTLRRSLFVTTMRHNVVFQWLRGFYIFGDDENNHSVFTKIIEAERRGEKSFPFNSGNNMYDFIDISDLARMIVASALQENVTGVINCCSGKPTRIGDKVDSFIKENNYRIKLSYGEFKDRPYDSPAIWGDNKKILDVLLSDTHDVIA